MALFRYSDADRTLNQVRRLAESQRDDAVLGDADGNLATMYAALGNLPTAEMYAREAVLACWRTNQKQYRQRCLTTLADIISRRQRFPESEGYFALAVSAASAIHDRSGEASAWLYYGMALLDHGRLDDAERAFAQSRGLAGSDDKSKAALEWNLGRLCLRRGDPRRAIEAIDTAIRSSRFESRLPDWRIYETRAQVELELGHPEGALEDARKSLEMARMLRVDVIPGNDDRVGAEGILDDAYSVLIDAGNQVYLKTHDPVLLRETFEAAEESRVDSLEKLLPTSNDWRKYLPAPQYWDKLSELVSVQRRVLGSPASPENQRLVRLRADLAEMESAARATVSPPGETILRRVRRRLPADASLFSFRLGQRASWLWTVHRGQLALQRLPVRRKLTAEIGEFENAIAAGDSRGITRFGRQIYRDLFGSVSPAVAASSQWFISADELLSTAPIPALLTGNRQSAYLGRTKALLVLPGARMLQPHDDNGITSDRFLAAGDGVYNRADPRYGTPLLLRNASFDMPRLPASAAEIRFAANFWRNPVLLTGSRLTRSSFLREIDRDPGVIHIATHVLPGQDRWRAGIMALGIDGFGEPELLTPDEIMLHPIHTRLVVMTGCASGEGEALPASGLMGLTRAWLAAGAGEVLATRWTTKDEDQAGLVGRFYKYLLKSRTVSTPEALRRAREDMIAGSGWRAQPRYWSGFFLIGVR